MHIYEGMSHKTLRCQVPYSQFRHYRWLVPDLPAVYSWFRRPCLKSTKTSSWSYWNSCGAKRDWTDPSWRVGNRCMNSTVFCSSSDTRLVTSWWFPLKLLLTGLRLSFVLIITLYCFKADWEGFTLKVNSNFTSQPLPLNAFYDAPLLFVSPSDKLQTMQRDFQNLVGKIPGWNIRLAVVFT